MFYNVYTLDWDIYADADYYVPDNYYHLSDTQASLNPNLTYQYSGSAVLRDYNNNGEPSYQLISYQR